MKRVVGLGACVLDTLIRCNTYPREDTKQRAGGIDVSGGGPVGNALVVMSKLGINAEVIGAFASDDAGKYLIKEFEEYGVGTAHATILDNQTSFTSYIILAENTSSRTCIFDRGTVPDCIENVALAAIDGADVLHIDGNYLESAIAAAEYARAHGVKVSLDAGGLYEGIERLLPLVNILIPSAEFACGYTAKEDIAAAMQELAKRYSPEVLVVTDGANGGYYWDGEPVKYDSFKVKAIDTNGAGDTFHGAFIAAYLNKKPLSECCRFASAVAAYKCKFTGAKKYPLNAELADNLQKLL